MLESTGVGRSRAMTVLALVAVLAFAKWAAAIVVPFLLAALCSIGFWPIMRRVRGPDWLGVLVTVAVVGATLVGFGWLVMAVATDFSSSLAEFGQALSDTRRSLSAWLVAHGMAPLAVAVARKQPSALAEEVVAPWIMEVADVAALIAVVGGLSIVVLLELRVLRDKLRSRGPAWATWVVKIGKRTRAVQRYLLVKALVSAMTGILAAVATWALDVPHPALWGLLAFVLNFVPVVGSYVAAIPAIIVALVSAGPRSAVALAGIYLVINGAIGFVVEPRLSGTAVGLSPLVILASIMFWGWMFGPIGALASVPLTMVVRILLSESTELGWVADLMDARRADKDPARSSRLPMPPSSSVPQVGR